MNKLAREIIVEWTEAAYTRILECPDLRWKDPLTHFCRANFYHLFNPNGRFSELRGLISDHFCARATRNFSWDKSPQAQFALSLTTIPSVGTFLRNLEISPSFRSREGFQCGGMTKGIDVMQDFRHRFERMSRRQQFLNSSFLMQEQKEEFPEWWTLYLDIEASHQRMMNSAKGFDRDDKHGTKSLQERIQEFNAALEAMNSLNVRSPWLVKINPMPPLIHSDIAIAFKSFPFEELRDCLDCSLVGLKHSEWMHIGKPDDSFLLNPFENIPFDAEDQQICVELAWDILRLGTLEAVRKQMGGYYQMRMK